MISHAALAYNQDVDLIRRTLHESGGHLTAVIDDHETNTFGYIADMPSGFSIVSFRGTQFLSAKDWRSNLNRSLLTFDFGGVHAGFADSFAACRHTLCRNVPKDRPVLLTGHSRGGAIATLAAAWMRDQGYSIAGVETFGSPRVGDAKFVAYYDKMLHSVTKRHVRCCDIVAKLPELWRGYRHVSGEVYHNADGDVPASSSLLYKILDQLDARIRSVGFVPTVGIRHHFLNSYRVCDE